MRTWAFLKPLQNRRGGDIFYLGKIENRFSNTSHSSTTSGKNEITTLQDFLHTLPTGLTKRKIAPTRDLSIEWTVKVLQEGNSTWGVAIPSQLSVTT